MPMTEVAVQAVIWGRDQLCSSEGGVTAILAPACWIAQKRTQLLLQHYEGIGDKLRVHFQSTVAALA